MSGCSSEPSSSSLAVIPWEQRSATPKDEKELMFEVLDNPSLREKILKHVIIGGDKKVDKRSACTLRRVEKSWNESVLRILWKAYEPLYKIVPGDGGKLNAFTKTFAVTSTASDSAPPLEIGRLSQATDLESFSNFLSRCDRPALLQLGPVIIDVFGDPHPSMLPPRSLSCLHKLEIIFRHRRRPLLTAGEQPEAEVAIGQQKIPECLVKSLLLGATALAELNLNVDRWFIEFPAVVSIFETITLPPSLVKLKMGIELDLQQSKDFVNAVLKSPLPMLSSVACISWLDVFAEGPLLSMMDKWKSSLKNLLIVGEILEDLPRNGTTIRFPVMEKLEDFTLSSATVELESGLRSLEKCFPKLCTLRLRHQTPGMLRKWTESSRFSKVTTLELILADGNSSSDDDPNLLLVGANIEALQLVKIAFPNLRRLGLGISKNDPSGLWYVFQEMRQLVELNLKVLGDCSARTTDVWDSMLTGVPVEKMSAIRGRDPGSPENGEGLVPITNLQELERLSVENDMSLRTHEPDVDGSSLISDFIFDHAFLKMPKLTHLHFEGAFKVSHEMIDYWLGEGRSLLYQPSSKSEVL